MLPCSKDGKPEPLADFCQDPEADEPPFKRCVRFLESVTWLVPLVLRFVSFDGLEGGVEAVAYSGRGVGPFIVRAYPYVRSYYNVTNIRLFAYIVPEASGRLEP